MSFLENDLMVDATFELLNDTIAMQSEQIEALEEKISALSSSHHEEVEKLKKEHLQNLNQQAISFADNFEQFENQVDLNNRQFCNQIKDSKESMKKLETALEASNAKISSLAESKECQRLKAARNKEELHLKDQAITQQFQEISELKKKLESEKTSKAHLETAYLELKISLKKKSQELEESIEDVNESYKLIESLQSTSEANEAKLAQNMLQLKAKIEQTCGAAIVYEASNKELNTENKNLSNLVAELMEDVKTLKDAKEQLEVKVYDIGVAKNDLAFALHQKEQIIEVLINDSNKAVAAVTQMLADSAYKDDSFCKLYEQHLEESKEKDDLIMELKAALADNAKEISDLQSVVKEILYNRI